MATEAMAGETAPIRRQATSDGVWTVFVGQHLCFSDLSGPEAEALAAAFARLAAGRSGGRRR